MVDHHTEEKHSLVRILGEEILEVEIVEFLQVTIGLLESGIEVQVNSFPVISEDMKEVVVSHDQIHSQVVAEKD